MSTQITEEYIKNNYLRLSGWLGAIRMSSRKTSDLDAALWLLAHHFNSEDKLNETLTFKAWKKRTSTPEYKTKHYFANPYLFEQLKSSIFQTLLRHNIIAGVRNMFPTTFLRLSTPIVNARSLSVYDVSDSLKFQTINNNNLILKSKDTDDIIWIKQSLDHISYDDRYGFFLEMMDKPSNTFSNNEFDKSEALKIFEFLELDRDLCIKRYLDFMLDYKVYVKFYQTPDFNTNLNNRISNVKKVLGMFYTEEQVEKSFLLYDMHRDNKQVIYNLKNMDKVISNDLPELC